MKRSVIVGLTLLAVLVTATAVLAMRAFQAEGRPRAGGLRYELWHDQSGWHLRWSGGKSRHEFTGRIWSPGGRIKIVSTHMLEPEDRIRTGPGSVSFRSHAAAGIDGFDFRWTGRVLFLDLKIDGRFRPMRIFVGAEGRHPSARPLVIRRGR